MKMKVVRFNIDVIDNNILSTSILEIDSEDFAEFEDSVLSTFAMNGYTFKECHQSNSKNSQSMYYTFFKIANSVKIKVLVMLSISGHQAPTRATKNGRRLSAKYLRNRYAIKLNEDENDDMVKVSKSIEIIFNDKKFTSYDAALVAISKRLSELESNLK